MARPLLCTLIAVAAASAALPAAAQFNPFEALFGPFRPPANIPGRSPPPDRLPPGPPPGVQREPLPPPPGAAPGQPQQGALPRPAQPRQSRATPPTEPQPPSGEIITPPAAKVTNPTAVFSGLDKITGRTITFDVAINETVQFGALQVTPRVCYTRPPTETPNTDAFIEVDEITLQGEIRRLFTGWMFASSPGLHAVEHPIYDVWLTDCKNPVVAAAPPPETAVPPPAQPAKPPT